MEEALLSRGGIFRSRDSGSEIVILSRQGTRIVFAVERVVLITHQRWFGRFDYIEHWSEYEVRSLERELELTTKYLGIAE